MFIGRVVSSLQERRTLKSILFRLNRQKTDKFIPMVAIQFSLTSLISFEEIPKEQLDHWNPQWSSFDFLIYDLEIGTPIVVVEYFGQQHFRGNNTQTMRDNFKAELLESIDVSLIIVTRNDGGYGLRQMESIVKEYREKVYG